MTDDNPLNLGPTGEFPEGQLNPEDEGEIRIAITHDKGVVVLAFGKPISWIGLPPQIAKELGAKIIIHAEKIEEANRAEPT